MKTAREILHDTARKYNDGFLSGQPKWILEAMEEYAESVTKKQSAKLNDLLTELEEYMEPKADVDFICDDVDCDPVPNPEMKLLVRIQEALSQLKTTVKQ